MISYIMLILLTGKNVLHPFILRNITKNVTVNGNKVLK